jgi:peptidoglycan-N-acetylglucosamine deacetylase
MNLLDNPVPWPDDATCAAAFTFDLDAESVLQVERKNDAHEKLFSLSMMRYGPQVAMPRLLRIFREYDMRSTFFVPGWVAERYPDAIEAIVAGGHEIGHHGYLHESPNGCTKEDERYWFERALDSLQRISGQRIVGYRAPSFDISLATPALLNEAGFTYDSSLMGDDVPYMLRDTSGSLLELPTSIILDDWPQYAHVWDLGTTNQISTPRRARELFLSEFDAVAREGGLWIGVWHPWISGRPARAQAMIEMIEHMRATAKVWFAPLAEIADHVRKVMAAGQWAPRIDDLPYHSGPLPEWDKASWTRR